MTVSPAKLREVLVTVAQKPVPGGEEWRVGLLQCFLQERLQSFYTGDDEKAKEIKELINSIVIN